MSEASSKMSMSMSMNSIITNTTLNDIFNYSDDSRARAHCIRVIGNTDQPWFNGKDIATILGYTNTKQAIISNVDEEDKLTLKQLNQGGSFELTLKKSSHQSVWINESGLYSLIFGSRLPSAKKFKRWVTSEVLPSIRTKGHYIYTEKISQLNKKLENGRFLSKKEHIKLSDRLIHHHKFISVFQYNYIYSTREIEYQGRIFKIRHPDFNRFKGYLLQLSKNISKNLSKNGMKSNITYKNRTNLYTKEMYEQFIDDIIIKFTNDKPLESLDIDWEWDKGDS